jgi:type VI secretion system protein ImpK
MSDPVAERQPQFISALSDEASGRRSSERLVDCFIEIITYTLVFLEEIKSKPLPFEEISRRYGSLWEHARKRGANGNFPPKDWEEAGFAVCAWMDETILCSNWTEKLRWQRDPLQRSLFGTINAGEEFYTRLAGIPEDKRQVRETYIYCLALGFKGRYFRPKDEEERRAVQAHHFQLLGLDPASDLPAQIFLSGYDLTQLPRRTRAARDPRRFIVTLLFFLLPLFVVGGLFWFYRSTLRAMFTGYLGFH